MLESELAPKMNIINIPIASEASRNKNVQKLFAF